MNKIAGKILKIVLPLVIGFLIIWLFTRKFTSEQIADIVNAFKRANYMWILLAMFLGLFSHFLRAVRWKMLIRPMGYDPSLKNTFFAVMIMYLANLAIHRLGEVSRCGILDRYEKVPFQKGLGTMVSERIVDLLMLSIVGVSAVLLQYDLILEFWNTNMGGFSSGLYSAWPYLVILLVIIVAIAGYLYMTKDNEKGITLKVRRLIVEGWEGIKSVRNLENPLMFWVLSVAIWVLYLLMIMVGFYALAETSSLGILAAFACLFIGSFGIIATPGGLGAYPVLISTLLILYGIEGTIGYALGWIVWGAQTLLIILVGLLSLILLSALNKRKQKSESFEKHSVEVS